MALSSQWGLVTELLLTQLLTLNTVESAASNWDDAYPAAGVSVELSWGGGSTEHLCNGLIIRERPFNLRLRGGTSDQLEAAAEDILPLWLGSSQRTALSALGVTKLLALTDDPPVVFHAADGGAMADYQFICQLEITY